MESYDGGGRCKPSRAPNPLFQKTLKTVKPKTFGSIDCLCHSTDPSAAAALSSPPSDRMRRHSLMVGLVGKHRKPTLPFCSIFVLRLLFSFCFSFFCLYLYLYFLFLFLFFCPKVLLYHFVLFSVSVCSVPSLMSEFFFRLSGFHFRCKYQHFFQELCSISASCIRSPAVRDTSPRLQMTTNSNQKSATA
jgi:hypothetical protein